MYGPWSKGPSRQITETSTFIPRSFSAIFEETAAWLHPPVSYLFLAHAASSFLSRFPDSVCRIFRQGFLRTAGQKRESRCPGRNRGEQFRPLGFHGLQYRCPNEPPRFEPSRKDPKTAAQLGPVVVFNSAICLPPLIKIRHREGGPLEQVSNDVCGKNPVPSATNCRFQPIARCSVLQNIGRLFHDHATCLGRGPIRRHRLFEITEYSNLISAWLLNRAASFCAIAFQQLIRQNMPTNCATPKHRRRDVRRSSR